MSAPQLASANPSAPALPPPRAFGVNVRDLDLNFETADRCTLATAVLAQCCDESEQVPAKVRDALAWQLPLGARIARLLRVASLTTESDAMGAVISCPQAECGKRFEVSLPLDALLPEKGENTATAAVVPFKATSGDELTFRLPTGHDQRRWRSRRYATAQDAALALLESLAVPNGERESSRAAIGTTSTHTTGDRSADHSRLPSAWRPLPANDLAALAAVMEAADPLVTFTVRTTCPHCDRDAEIPVDLESLALQQLAQERRRIVRVVHDLATRYGWSEADVLAVPRRRRAEYLRLIEAADNPFA